MFRLIFECAVDISFRRALRWEYPFASVASTSHSQSGIGEEITPIPELVDEKPITTRDYTIEILQTLAAGGLAGSMSAIVPYP